MCRFHYTYAKILVGIYHAHQSFVLPQELGCVDFGLPWWGSIAALTVVIRVVMLPFVVKVMRNNINMSNIKPQMDAIIASSKAKTEKGDQVGAAKDMQSLKVYIPPPLPSLSPRLSRPPTDSGRTN